MRFLLFTLYAPMGAFGEIAVGERRMSWARPGRSAILGLVAAARGIDREDEKAQMELESSLHFAVRTDAPGRSLIDYQTAQAPRARKGRRHATRREELQDDRLNTVLSVREWRVDAFHTVALWPRAGADGDLERMAESLNHPAYVLYLGRKSAPLGLPLRPEIVIAETFLDALSEREPNRDERTVLVALGRKASVGTEIAFDADVPIDLPDSQIQRRRDAIASRSRWQFMDRWERIVLVNESGK